MEFRPQCDRETRPMTFNTGEYLKHLHVGRCDIGTNLALLTITFQRALRRNSGTRQRGGAASAYRNI
jgi:hypothetical protein